MCYYVFEGDNVTFEELTTSHGVNELIWFDIDHLMVETKVTNNEFELTDFRSVICYLSSRFRRHKHTQNVSFVL
jgi:hypothetical protein